MFVTGSDVIREVTHEEVTFEDLGGAKVHCEKSGVCHLALDSEEECLARVRQLVSYIPSNNVEEPLFQESEDPPHRSTARLRDIIPDSSKAPYDMRELVREVVDMGTFFEIQPDYAGNILVGFARIGGRSIGIVGNQPAVLAGCLDINASIKGARFIRFCDAFNIPLITFEDVPGFLPGTAQEWGGIIKHGAKLLYAYCEATVPKITLITRKAYGGAYDVMNSRHIRADMVLAFPTAEVAVMGPEGAVKILYRQEIQDAEDPEARRVGLIDEYRRTFANPYSAAERGFIDRIIDPIDTRRELISALNTFQNKRDSNPAKKHGNIPL